MCITWNTIQDKISCSCYSLVTQILTSIDLLMLPKVWSPVFKWSAAWPSQSRKRVTEKQNFALLLVCFGLGCACTAHKTQVNAPSPVWRVESGCKKRLGKEAAPIPGIQCLRLQRRVLRQAGRMQKAVILVSLLVLGWTGTLQGLPVLPEPLYPTQENFDQAQVSDTMLPVNFPLLDVIFAHST